MITDKITGKARHREREQSSPSSVPRAAPDTEGWNWGTLPTNGALPLDFWVALRVGLCLLGLLMRFFLISPLQVVQILGKWRGKRSVVVLSMWDPQISVPG